jgi:hypothetical protein
MADAGKSRLAHHVLGMKMRGCNVESASRRKLTGNVGENPTVFWSQPAVNHQRCFPADNDADIGLRPWLTFENHRDVIRKLQRRSSRPALCPGGDSAARDN